MCDWNVDRGSRMPMAAVVEGCGELGVGTPTQYVARWTEVAVVASERGYLASDSAVSFDNAAAVDAARPGVEEAVREAISRRNAASSKPGRRPPRSCRSWNGRGVCRPPADGASGARVEACVRRRPR